MRLGSYSPQWLKCSTDGGDIWAITFVMNTRSINFVRSLTLNETARIVDTAAGQNGSCRDYVLATIAGLAQAGVDDADLLALNKLLARSRSHA
jgi:cation transport regulator ChaC